MRRALAPGALWQLEGTNRPSLFRRPQLGGTLLVLEVVPLRRITFQLTGERMDVELDLQPPILLGVSRARSHHGDGLPASVGLNTGSAPPGLLWAPQHAVGCRLGGGHGRAGGEAETGHATMERP